MSSENLCHSLHHVAADFCAWCFPSPSKKDGPTWFGAAHGGLFHKLQNALELRVVATSTGALACVYVRACLCVWGWVEALILSKRFQAGIRLKEVQRVTRASGW